jgi:putative endonuclease
MTQHELGVFGELLARDFLQKIGYSHIAFNYHYGREEVDIISKTETKIIITEVKTRQTAEIGEPWRAVTKTKQRQIIRVADAYIKEHEIDLNVRFDIISIVHNSYSTQIEHIEDAFGC